MDYHHAKTPSTHLKVITIKTVHFNNDSVVNSVLFALGYHYLIKLNGMLKKGSVGECLRREQVYLAFTKIL